MNKQEYQTLLAQCAATLLAPMMNVMKAFNSHEAAEKYNKERIPRLVEITKALLKEVGIEEEEDIDGIKIACREAFPNQTK
uniref:Uncharacterized protein n=1 Tax=viral metagenome TaxID=1070528 RepID=A0A6H1ZGJ2_9ZZZZ